MLSRNLAIFRRGFSESSKSASISAEEFRLNRYSGLALDTDFTLDDDLKDELDELDFGDEAGPIVAQVQRSKSVLRGGNKLNAGTARARSQQTIRSGRQEEIYKRSHMIFEGDVRVRVMDVDRFRLDELHHYFMYTLVRRFPAEKCVKVASRIAVFRDKQTQHSFESMNKDVAELFGPVYGPELTALFSRCYNTIPVAFMLDYTRRFGKFSRKYIALQVDKTLNPRLFDFVRYPSGVRPLPGIVTRPFALRSFAWLLSPCSAKKYIFQHLLAHSGNTELMDRAVQRETSLSSITSGQELDPHISVQAKIGERVAAQWKLGPRPRKLPSIDSSAAARNPTSANELLEELEIQVSTGNIMAEVDGGFNLQTAQVQPFVSPLMEDSSSLEVQSHANAKNSTELEILQNSDDYESASESWWKSRKLSASFFRFNKKAYRLNQTEGWKQVEDPRGELPDYGRSRALRNHLRKIRANSSRKAKIKQRNSAINTVIRQNISIM
jgi:hypothetical protein